jgi:hypothetical protein
VADGRNEKPGDSQQRRRLDHGRSEGWRSPEEICRGDPCDRLSLRSPKPWGRTPGSPLRGAKMDPLSGRTPGSPLRIIPGACHIRQVSFLPVEFIVLIDGWAWAIRIVPVQRPA